MYRKYLILDANIMIDYFVHENKDIFRKMKDIENSKKVFFILSNLCIGEVYKVIAREKIRKKQDKEDIEAYKRVREKFSKKISRTDQWINVVPERVTDKGAPPVYYNLDFQRYHLLNCQHLYPFIQIFEEKFPEKDRNGNLKQISNVDMFTIGQAMELTYLMGKDNVCVLTRDKYMVEFGEYLDKKLTTFQKHQFSVPDFISYPNIINIYDDTKLWLFIG